MEVLEASGKKFLKFSNLAKAGVFHFTTTKNGWIGNGKSRFTGDHPDVYQPFRNELSDALLLNEKQFIFPRQVHGTRIELVSFPMQNPDIPQTDALITNQSGLCLCVQTADCVPILLYDEKQKIVASIHAGWKGTVNKIVAETIKKMIEKFNSVPKQILAGIGPSASPSVYEIGSDVIFPVMENFSNHAELLVASTKPNKAYFNLWAANKTLLVESGVPEKNIEIMGFCSISDEELFYSARRDGADTGRMVSGIML